MDARRDLVLVTGAAGRVATLIMPTLRETFRLRRLDIVEQSAEGDDEIVRADIRSFDAVETACTGASAVVHLAAQPAEADFRTLLLPRNLEGTWVTYEAAVRARVPRFVFASTVQTVTGNPEDTFVRADLPPRPESVYGCTKLFGEALGRYYADTTALSVACLRLGAVRPADETRLTTDEAFRSLWCGAGDLARLVVAAVRSPVRFATVIAVSAPGVGRFDTSNPFGWEPEEVPLAR